MDITLDRSGDEKNIQQNLELFLENLQILKNSNHEVEYNHNINNTIFVYQLEEL